MKAGDKVIDRRTGELVTVEGDAHVDHLRVRTSRGLDAVHVRELFVPPERKLDLPVKTKPLKVKKTVEVANTAVTEVSAIAGGEGYDANGSPVVDLE